MAANNGAGDKFENLKYVFKSRGWGRTGTGPLPTDDLTPPLRDALFLYQRQLKGPENDPKHLTPESLYVAKIVETHQYARSVFGTLQKLGILDYDDGNGSGRRASKSQSSASSAGAVGGSVQPGTNGSGIRTDRITKQLTNEISLIPMHKVKTLVNLLYDWDEEVTRWEGLEAEMREIEGVAGSEGRHRELVLMMGVVPSRRNPDGSLIEDGHSASGTHGEPPAYVQ